MGVDVFKRSVFLLFSSKSPFLPGSGKLIIYPNFGRYLFLQAVVTGIDPPQKLLPSLTCALYQHLPKGIGNSSVRHGISHTPVTCNVTLKNVVLKPCGAAQLLIFNQIYHFNFSLAIFSQTGLVYTIKHLPAVSSVQLIYPSFQGPRT